MKLLNIAVACLLSLSFTASAMSQIVHDESVDGDLSGVFSAPQSVIFNLGANTVVGQIGNNGFTGATNGQDADYFSFSLGPGQQLQSVTIDSFTSPGFPGSSFMGFVGGTSFAGQGAGDLDGNTLFNAGSGDVLPALAGGPLPSGDYSIWLQETSDNVVDYSVTFNVAVPEPSSAVFVGTFAALGLIRRRR
jgi:hypothetical protein